MINIKIFILDDEEEICSSISEELSELKYINVEFSIDPENGLKKLLDNEYDILILDYKMPKMDGFDILDKLKTPGRLENLKVIFITAYGDLQTGIKAIDKGCFDYLEKPFNMKNLLFRIQQIIKYLELNEKVKVLSQSFDTDTGLIMGNSKKMIKIINIVKKIANKNTIILITGETGTGKELVAKAIHRMSKQKDNIFIPINCSALSETLLESELFGYEKGAFTGALTKKSGIFETASEGTIFLDEINSASLNVQMKLLRVIESGEFIRVGGNNLIYSDARIIAATNQNLEDLIKEKKFREDLYHRLNIVKIEIPPLRDRREDIQLLVNYFFKKYNKKFNKQLSIYKTALKYLINYHWPGNVRQLENFIHALVLLNDSKSIKPENLPEIVRSKDISNYNNLIFKEIKKRFVTDFEVNFLIKILKLSKGNVSKASKIIKLSRKNFKGKLKEYNINPAEFK